MLAGILALIILFAKAFPETSFGRSVHLYAVELPLRMAHQIERRHLILLIILLCSGQMLAMMGSVELALAYAADMSIYYDAAIAASLTAAAASVKRAWATFTGAFARLFGAIFRPMVRARRGKAAASRLHSAANDDDPAQAWREAA